MKEQKYFCNSLTCDPCILCDIGSDDPQYKQIIDA